MKILCPTDFSPAALNGIEYAARLAQKTKSSLTFLHIQKIHIHEGVSLFSGGEIESVKESKVAAKTLKDICADIKKTFNLDCTYEIIPAVGLIENIISTEAEKFDLTVIGTNGADSAYEYYFGSHSFRIARGTNTPVLIVPDDCTFKEITNVVFASDYNKDDELYLKQLKDFADIFKTHINVIHISKNDTELGKQVYKSFCNLLEETFGYDNRMHFKRIISEEPADAIEQFTHQTNSELLAIYFHPHSLLYRLFHENLIKKITSRADFPMLVFHQ